MSLRKQAARGASWLLLEKVVGQAINFVVFVIVVRLVGPEEFGLVGLCAVFASLTSLLLFGGGDAVISQNLTKGRALSTLFWAVAGIGLLLSATTFLIAQPFAALMNDQRLAPLVRGLSPLPLLLALTVIPGALLQSRLAFRVFTIRSLAANIGGGVIGIWLAYRGHGAFALVIQQIARQVIGNLLIWSGARWFPRLEFDRGEFRRVVSPAVKLGAVSVFTLFEQQVPRLIIGLILGPVSVGFFALSSRLYQTLSQVTVLPMTAVFYPVLAKIKDATRARDVLAEFIWIIGFVTIPAICGAVVTAPIFVPLFFGEKWLACIPLVQWFLIAMLPRPFYVAVREYLRADSKTSIFIGVQAVISLGVLVMVLIMTRQGMLPLMTGFAIVSLLTIPVNGAILKHRAQLSILGDLLKLWPVYLGTAVMIVSVYLWQSSAAFPENRWLGLSSSIILGGMLYFAICAALRLQRIKKIVSDLTGSRTEACA